VTYPWPLLSASELAALLDCRDLTGAPAAHVVLQWAAEGSIPAPDIRRPTEGADGAYWYPKTIADFLDRLSGKPEPLLVDGPSLAAMLGVSERWVSAHRHRIIGAQKIGGRWRYNVEIIRRLISAGKDVVSAPVNLSISAKAKPPRKYRI
jgi:hypothetical protein